MITDFNIINPKVDTKKPFYRKDKGVFYFHTNEKYRYYITLYNGDEYAESRAELTVFDENQFTITSGRVGESGLQVSTISLTTPVNDGSILVNATATNAALQVVCGTTMPDGQKAIKFIAL